MKYKNVTDVKWQQRTRIQTFLNEYDFTGKEVYVFCTSGSSGPEKSGETVAKLCKDAHFHSSIRVSGQKDDVLIKWLES